MLLVLALDEGVAKSVASKPQQQKESAARCTQAARRLCVQGTCGRLMAFPTAESKVGLQALLNS